MYLQTLALVLLMSHCSLGDDDDIEGPLLPLKADGGLYTTEEIIKERKYTGESHTVQTEDGYKLTVFRVVQVKKPSTPVLLQHGYLISSDAWVTDPEALAFRLSDAGYDVWINNARGNAYSKSHGKLKPEEREFWDFRYSAFRLSDAGYDVWINNARGNAYSRSHGKLKPEEREFWDFSWHEMGTKDLPAVIDHVLNTTGQSSLHLIGHSMGATMSFVLASSRPEYNQKLKSLVGLAPVAFLSKMVQMVGPDGMVEEMVNKYMKQWKDSGEKVEVFPRKDVVTDTKSQITCLDVEESYRDMCVDKMEEVQKVIGGAYMPAGTSYRTMDHFYQMSVTGVMKHYKFDSAEDNKKAYGSEEPPSYTDNFKKITAPTLLWSTDVDQMVMTKDVDDLVALLPNIVADNRLQDVECFDHIAFLFPRQKSCIPERAKVYNSLIEAIQKLEKK